MKKVIDTIKEIIKKDVSTQTEPVTIIENEKDMPQIPGQPEGQQLSDLKLKRDEYNVEIRRDKRGDILTKKRNNNLETDKKKYLSGQDHFEEQARLEEELEAKQQIEPDASFYDKCKRYVEQVYPEEVDSSDLYSGIAGSLSKPIVNNNSGFNVERFSKMLKNIFDSIVESTYDEETKKEKLILKAAGTYAVCIDDEDIKTFLTENNAVNFTDPGLLKQTIHVYLAEVTSYELAGEVFDILDNIN